MSTGYRSRGGYSSKDFLEDCAEHGWYPVGLLERLGELGRKHSSTGHSSIRQVGEQRNCITDGKNYLWWYGGKDGRCSTFIDRYGANNVPDFIEDNFISEYDEDY